MAGAVDGLIDLFLKDTGASIPKPNPAYYNVHPEEGGADEREGRYDGWVSRFNETTQGGGTLTVSGGRRGAFLGISGLKSSGR